MGFTQGNAMELNVTKAAARETVRKLIAIHQQTLRDIEGGKKFWAGGIDVAETIKKRVEHELKQCQQVDDALDYMRLGDVQRAAALCEQIKEHLA